MKNTIQQFYSLFREAMHENKLTAADISAAKGVHYTYIYNSIRNNANLTLQTADDLARSAGYTLKLVFEPIDTAAKLTGNMDSTGPLYSTRKPKAQASVATLASATPKSTLEDDIADLLKDDNA